MANPQNLKTPTSKQARENGRKGGLASAKAKKERKAIRDLVEDFLESDCNDSPQFKALARKLNIDSTESKKKLFAVTCIMNTMKKGRLEDLQTLQAMLGEDVDSIGTETVDDPLSKALREEAERLNMENCVESEE